MDPGHCVSLHVPVDAATAAASLAALLDNAGYEGSSGHAACGRFRATLKAANAAAAREAAAALADIEAAEGISEMAVALAVTENLPAASGLFIGNSMPIRDIDMLSGIYRKGGGGGGGGGSGAGGVGAGAGPGAPVTANRGASGIDGVVSAAAGYAAGLGQPVTLLIGDVSFQHDANGLLLLRERPGRGFNQNEHSTGYGARNT